MSAVTVVAQKESLRGNLNGDNCCETSAKQKVRPAEVVLRYDRQSFLLRESTPAGKGILRLLPRGSAKTAGLVALNASGRTAFRSPTAIEQALLPKVAAEGKLNMQKRSKSPVGGTRDRRRRKRTTVLFIRKALMADRKAEACSGSADIVKMYPSTGPSHQPE